MSLSQTVKWIPVSERLPENYKEVFVAYADGEVNLASWQGESWCHDDLRDDDESEPITHWAEFLKHPSKCTSGEALDS